MITLEGVRECLDILHSYCPGKYTRLKTQLEFAYNACDLPCPGHLLLWVCHARCAVPRGRGDWEMMLDDLMGRVSVILNNKVFHATHGVVLKPKII